jgi:hypothetical protein
VQDLEKTKTFALENGTTNNKSMLWSTNYVRIPKWPNP